VFAKGLGGGYPVAALGGRRDIMSLVAAGTVSMAGTYAANGIAVAAANAALDELSQPGKYEALFARCERFYDSLSEILKAHRLPGYVVGLGPVLQVWFAEHPIKNYRDAAVTRTTTCFGVGGESMLEHNILFHPGAFENLFVSFAHSDEDIDRTLKAADDVAVRFVPMSDAPRAPDLALGIDLGTSAVKVMAIDAAGSVVGEAQGTFATLSREPLQAEQSTADWFDRLGECDGNARRSVGAARLCLG